MLFLPREEGQGLVEYALILVLVAIVVIAILLLLGPVVGNVFSNIVATFNIFYYLFRYSTNFFKNPTHRWGFTFSSWCS